MLHDRLKALKSQCKLTTKQIAEISGVPESTISRILSGETENPTYFNIVAIVSAMGATMADLTDTAPTEKKAVPPPTVVDVYQIAYQNAIEDRAYWRRFSMIELGIIIGLIVALVALFTYDILNRNIGWFRYAAEHFSNAFGSLFENIL